MAGESPDRSKQRESSEEPTSGSAGPVPEARTEAGEPRDPRLAVARDSAEPSASAGSRKPRGGVDTATRVLSVRDTDTEAETPEAGGAKAGTPEAETPEADTAEAETPEGGSEAGAAADDEAKSESESGSEAGTDAEPEPEAGTVAGSEPDAETGSGAQVDGEDGDGPEEAGGKSASETSGDGRLRDAVAAWVATADERAAANARPEAEGEPEDAASPGKPAQDADAAPDGPEDASDGPDASEERADERAAAEPRPDADGTDDAAKDEAEDEPGADESPVDQPTAVFKAVRPPAKPSVDQPTTMLKLGDAGKKGGETDKPGKADKPDEAGTPETEAERTSKFVALRQPDDPATRKPPRPAQPAQPGTGAPRASAAAATAAVPQVGPDRTTQQPLPPKPPLDLLAELTNTPPPPETPLRTTVRRVKIWTPLVVLLVIVFGVVQSMRPLPEPTLDLTAQESFTFEGGKPEIPWPSAGQAALDVQGIGSFGSSGEQKPVPIASVAKVMTAYVILRDHPLKSGAAGPEIAIDQTAEDQSEAGQESTVKVYAGDKISEREALQSILIASANNVARLLARWDAGSEKAFVEKMNAAAKDLGMTNTTYTDPSGLNNTTVSTAVDQVKLAKEAMKQPAFREVAAMMSYDDYKGVNHGNWNQLVGHNNVVGIKTGTTTSALGNLVFAAKKEVGGETRTIVGAVVRQPATADEGILAAALSAGDKLIRAAQDTLESSTILKKGSVVGYVDDGLGGRTPVVATQDVKAVGWPGLTVKLTFEADEVPHTAKAGTKVGTLTVGDGGVSGAVKVPVALQQDLVEPSFTDKLTRIG
ncbi:D-alanyl-D-alanine carboxypeptidase [Streptomyces sp. NPDC003719]